MPQAVFNWGFQRDWQPYDIDVGNVSPSYYESYGTQKVIFDGPNKLIIVAEGTTEINFRDDVYEAWKEWVRNPDYQNAEYLEAITVLGGDPLPGDRLLGATFFLENGWRMRTWEGDHELTVTGNVFTRTGVPLFVPTLFPWTITINLNTSTLVEAFQPIVQGNITLDGGSIPTAVEIRQEIDANSTQLANIYTVVSDTQTTVDSMDANILSISATLTNVNVNVTNIDSTVTSMDSNVSSIDSNVVTINQTVDEINSNVANVYTYLTTQGSLTSVQAKMLLEMYELLGLDPAKPLVVTQSARTAGNISQTIDTTPTQTTVTRN